ncbi:MAG: glycoside hydrolase family 3 protein [Spirochaetales bacterium]
MKQASDLTIEEAVGHLLCPILSGFSADEIRRLQERDRYGSVFFNRQTFAEWRETVEAVQSAAPWPVLVSADLEFGARSITDKAVQFPWLMGAAAADDDDAVYAAGLATGIEGRHAGVHWTFAPVVDINYNFRAPETNIRSFGDDPERVARLASRFIRGVQEQNRVAATAKHFPGTGMDERDQHLVTAINPLSVDAWMKTYGMVWRRVIETGVLSIMSGHIAFPDYEGHRENLEAALPATISSRLQIDLLRKELGFEGVLVSDAAPMVGIASRCTQDEAVVRFIEAGGDVFLFARPERDYDLLMEAVRSGRLSEERVRESAARVIALKERLGIEEDVYGPAPDESAVASFREASRTIAERSVTVQRDNGLVGRKPQAGAKVLTVTLDYEGHKFLPEELDAFDAALRERGYQVEHLRNPGHNALIDRAPEFETIFVNIHLTPHMLLGHTRLYAPLAMHFWRGFYVDLPDVRFTSFGSPYLLYDQPHLPNMLVGYGGAESVQRAAVAIWLGEITARGKSPVRLPRTVIHDSVPNFAEV